mmetsp:Transcript_1162/g.1629  ORF Transcript_1162/g.1629 Transcript_1162/m.1629 type:complete len:225 (-) Transcript_1162:525-1199(-)
MTPSAVVSAPKVPSTFSHPGILTKCWTTAPTEAIMATRPCLISAERNFQKPLSSPTLQKPSGSKNPKGATAPGCSAGSKGGGGGGASSDSAGATAAVACRATFLRELALDALPANAASPINLKDVVTTLVSGVGVALATDSSGKVEAAPRNADRGTAPGCAGATKARLCDIILDLGSRSALGMARKERKYLDVSLEPEWLEPKWLRGDGAREAIRLAASFKAST